MFTDVRQEVSREALRYLVARLVCEPDVGGVSGELVHVDPQTHAAAHIGLYWRYEKWIRKAESRTLCPRLRTGALYAIWHRDYTVLPGDTLLDDVVIPLGVLRHGRRVVLDERAVIYDELQNESAGERRQDAHAHRQLPGVRASGVVVRAVAQSGVPPVPIAQSVPVVRAVCIGADVRCLAGGTRHVV